MTAHHPAAPPPPLFGVVGWKNAGKTTLVEKLVGEFTRRGLRVATIKHAHHSFDIDHPGTDSFRHRSAGAQQTALVSAKRVAVMRELTEEAESPNLWTLADSFAPCDLILVEGFKSETHAKIELRSTAQRRDDGPMMGRFANIVALALDDALWAQTNRTPQDNRVPLFQRDDISKIADFIAAYLNLTATPSR